RKCLRQPRFDSVECGLIRVFLRDARAIQDFERVVSSFHDKKISRSLELLDNWPQLVRRPERVTRALHEQHRNFDGRQMLHPKLIYFAGRMKRVAKEDEGLGIGTGSSNLRSDSST